MKPCLADINVLLALLVRDHDHKKAAQSWFDGLSTDEAGLCRHVQLGLIRLLGNRHVMREFVLPAATAWRLLEELLEDDRISFVREPEHLDPVMSGLCNLPVPAEKLVSDAYLAAFAIASSRRMVTFDSGFRQFKGLEVEILAK